jgi:hypothetical protein
MTQTLTQTTGALAADQRPWATYERRSPYR